MLNCAINTETAEHLRKHASHRLSCS